MNAVKFGECMKFCKILCIAVAKHALYCNFSNIFSNHIAIAQASSLDDKLFEFLSTLKNNHSDDYDYHWNDRSFNLMYRQLTSHLSLVIDDMWENYQYLDMYFGYDGANVDYAGSRLTNSNKTERYQYI